VQLTVVRHRFDELFDLPVYNDARENVLGVNQRVYALNRFSSTEKISSEWSRIE